MSDMKSVLRQGFSVDEGDSSVGLFGLMFVHEVCPQKYDLGVEHETRTVGPVDDKGYVDEIYVLTCLDCGTSTEFVNREFVGWDLEEDKP